MKKFKFLMPVTLVAAVATPLMATTACSKTGATPYIEEDSNVEIKVSAIELNKEIKITCTPKSGYEIDENNILIKIGSKVITKDTINGFVIKDNVITVAAADVTSTNVYIKVPVTAKVTAIDFATCSWQEVADAANKGSDYCAKRFGVTDITKMIGKTKTLKTYDDASTKQSTTEQTVRIIDVNHDTYIDSSTGELKTAVFTFEFVDCIDKSAWISDVEEKVSYVISDLNGKIDGKDVGDVPSRIVDSAITNNVKSALKPYTYFDFTRSDWQSTAKLYVCGMNFFALSAVEYGITVADMEEEGFYGHVEGWVYDYYKDASTTPAKRSKAYKRTSGDKADKIEYRTRQLALNKDDPSPDIYAFGICEAGDWAEQYCQNNTYGVAPAFCL